MKALATTELTQAYALIRTKKPFEEKKEYETAEEQKERMKRAFIASICSSGVVILQCCSPDATRITGLALLPCKKNSLAARKVRCPIWQNRRTRGCEFLL